jgi:hypothetical protein
VRFNFMAHLDRPTPVDGVLALTARLVPLGWHLQVHGAPNLLTELGSALRRSPVPGTVAAARYWRGGTPRHLALYNLTHREVLGSAPWLAVRHTDWSSWVRPWFRQTRRLMFVAA